MTDREIITNYHDTVLLIHDIRQRIDWNQRQGLPVAELQQEENQLMHNLLRAEEILSGITDLRSRIILRLHYMLHMKTLDIAIVLNVSKTYARKLWVEALAAVPA